MILIGQYVRAQLANHVRGTLHLEHTQLLKYIDDLSELVQYGCLDGPDADVEYFLNVLAQWMIQRKCRHIDMVDRYYEDETYLMNEIYEEGGRILDLGELDTLKRCDTCQLLSLNSDISLIAHIINKIN